MCLSYHGMSYFEVYNRTVPRFGYDLKTNLPSDRIYLCLLTMPYSCSTQYVLIDHSWSEETRVTAVTGELGWSSSTVSVSGAIRGYVEGRKRLDTCQHLGVRWIKLVPAATSLTLSLTLQAPRTTERKRTSTFGSWTSPEARSLALDYPVSISRAPLCK